MLPTFLEATIQREIVITSEKDKTGKRSFVMFFRQTLLGDLTIT